jgi:hypothetical protein
MKRRDGQLDELRALVEGRDLGDQGAETAGKGQGARAHELDQGDVDREPTASNPTRRAGS